MFRFNTVNTKALASLSEDTDQQVIAPRAPQGSSYGVGLYDGDLKTQFFNDTKGQAQAQEVLPAATPGIGCMSCCQSDALEMAELQVEVGKL